MWVSPGQSSAEEGRVHWLQWVSGCRVCHYRPLRRKNKAISRRCHLRLHSIPQGSLWQHTGESIFWRPSVTGVLLGGNNKIMMLFKVLKANFSVSPQCQAVWWRLCWGDRHRELGWCQGKVKYKPWSRMTLLLRCVWIGSTKTTCPGPVTWSQRSTT